MMKAFLKSLDEKVWHQDEHGWMKPKTPFTNWTRDESTNCNWNNKSLNVIFIVVYPDEFQRISMCEIAKEAWDILEVTHKRTKMVKNFKLQIPTSRFEEIRLLEYESFNGFYLKLNYVVNSKFNLRGKKKDS
jgi:hypothetical protein